MNLKVWMTDCHITCTWKLTAICMFYWVLTWVFSSPFSAQWKLWSDWADAQADLSFRWAHFFWQNDSAVLSDRWLSNQMIVFCIFQSNDIETPHGNVHVAIQGDRSKPAILTYHDIGLNRKYNNFSWSSYECYMGKIHILKIYNQSKI